MHDFRFRRTHVHRVGASFLPYSRRYGSPKPARARLVDVSRIAAILVGLMLLSLARTSICMLDVGRQGGEAGRQCTSYSLCWALCALRWEPARTSFLRTWH